MSSKITDFSSAYKLTRRTENSSTREDWKNKRYDEVGKRRNLDKMSPLEEFSQNLTSSQNRKTHNYDGKTPLKKGTLSKEISRKEMLLKWHEERKMMKQQESRKEKPLFKFHHVEHSDKNLYNIHTAGVKNTNSSNLSKVMAPIAVSMANTKPARMTRGTKMVTSTMGKEQSHCSTKQISTSRNNTHSAGVKTTNSSKVSTSKNVKNTVQQRIKPPFPSATHRVPHQMTSTKAVENKSSSSASSDEDVTKYSVLVDGKKVKRSTRQSSVSKPDAGQSDLSV